MRARSLVLRTSSPYAQHRQRKRSVKRRPSLRFCTSISLVSLSSLPSLQLLLTHLRHSHGEQQVIDLNKTPAWQQFRLMTRAAPSLIADVGALARGVTIVGATAAASHLLSQEVGRAVGALGGSMNLQAVVSHQTGFSIAPAARPIITKVLDSAIDHYARNFRASVQLDPRFPSLQDSRPSRVQNGTTQVSRSRSPPVRSGHRSPASSVPPAPSNRRGSPARTALRPTSATHGVRQPR